MPDSMSELLGVGAHVDGSQAAPFIPRSIVNRSEEVRVDPSVRAMAVYLTEGYRYNGTVVVFESAQKRPIVHVNGDRDV